MNKYRGFIIWSAIIILLCVIYAYVVSSKITDINERSAFGDMFGGINAVFAGLAFAGVIYAIILQSTELALQREELKLTREELELTRKEVARSATAQEESGHALEEQLKAMMLSAEISQATLTEMRETRLQEISPHVVVFFDIQVPENLIYLVVKNVGKSMASHIKIDFSPPLAGTLSEQVNEVVGSEIQALPPNYEVRTIFHEFLSYIHMPSGYPLRYNVSVTYSGTVTTADKSVIYVLDITPYRTITFITPVTMKDIVKEIKKVDTGLKNISSELRKLSLTIGKSTDNLGQSRLNLVLKVVQKRISLSLKREAQNAKQSSDKHRKIFCFTRRSTSRTDSTA